MKNPLRFENSKRLEEINIIESLNKAGINKESVVCDYGTGTGVFAVEAAKLTSSKVYALDASDDMLKIIDSKISDNNITNIVTKKVLKDAIDLEGGAVDLFMLVTVLHEICDVPDFVVEVKRVLKEKGRVMIIDFIKKEGDFGPSLRDRMSAYQATRHFFREGINFEAQYELGDNFYLLILKNEE